LVDLFAVPNTAELAFEMLYRIHQVAFFTFLGLFIKSFYDHIPHTRIDKYMDLLKSISKCGAEESKLRLPWLLDSLRLRRRRSASTSSVANGKTARGMFSRK
jgi:hypothetical protein